MKLSENFKKQHLNYLRSYLPQEIMDSADFQTAVFANLDDLVELSTTDVCEARKKGLGLSGDELFP